MTSHVKRSKTRLVKVLLLILLLLALLTAAFLFYASDHRKPDQVAEAARALAEEQGLLTETDDYIAIGDPDGAELGYVFYPGGKVDAAAYIPYLLELNVQEKLFCAVVKPPFRLAILDTSAADKVLADHPQIRRWALGGHSLGGTSAARYVEKHMGAGGDVPAVEALVLLASYPDTDLSAWEGQVLSVTAGMDRIMDRDRYEKAMSLLPPQPRTLYYFLSNGNHSQFGNYGQQEGDGRANTSGSSQREDTVAVTGAFLWGRMGPGSSQPSDPT